MSELLLQPGARILFQGDSITDCERERDDANNQREDELGLGKGYALFAASWINAMYPERNLSFLNRGNSGNTVEDLKARWTEDCVALKPDWVSILIGINDSARAFQGEGSSAANFDKVYRELLDRVKNETDANIIILEPFLLHVQPEKLEWRVELDPRIHIVRAIARDYKAILIPLDGLFSAISVNRNVEFWAADGVHPSRAGHAMIAQAWLQAVNAI